MAVSALSDTDIRSRLESLAPWSLDDGKLYRKFEFDDFVEAFGFMARVALVAEKMEHHPEWRNVWNTVEVHLTTHDAGGVSEKDFELARTMDELAE